MKKILYICTNPIENWDIFIPETDNDHSQNAISLLLLHEKQNLEILSVSQVWYLNEGEQDKGDEKPKKKISYQDFLKEIFSHDLSVVI